MVLPAIVRTGRPNKCPQVSKVKPKSFQLSFTSIKMRGRIFFRESTHVSRALPLYFIEQNGVRWQIPKPFPKWRSVILKPFASDIANHRQIVEEGKAISSLASAPPRSPL